jgi:hypothetical protein
MDYTNSPQRVVHLGTGKRMHSDTATFPTVVSANDLNQINWALMEVVLAAGLVPSTFNPDVPATYTQLKLAIIALAGGSAPATTHTLGLVGSTLTSTVNGVARSVVLPSGGGGGGGGATSNLLSVAGNVLTSTVDGLVATANLPTSTAVGLGVGQAWANYSGSRLANVTYTNTTGKPIQVSIRVGNSGVSGTPGTYFLVVGGVSISSDIDAVIPVGATYELNGSPNAGDSAAWFELR